MSNGDSSHALAPLFLGAYAENNDLLEKLLLEHLREHIFWRRNFHPDDRPPISTTAQYDPAFLETEARIREALHELASRLKRSVPFFHPRYVGHMASDLMLPGLVAQLVTTMYNPNNVCIESASVTIDMELEAGRCFAKMFGFSTQDDEYPKAWGHLSSGGTSANIEALWNLRHARFLALAMAKAAQELGDDDTPRLADGRPLVELNDWELFNLPIDESLLLWREWVLRAPDGEAARRKAALIQHLPEHSGLAAYFMRHWMVKPPVVLVPATAHYSWKKAMRLLGLGTQQLVKVAVDRHMRMDMASLERVLRQASAMQTPVLAVVAVLGTTEFGTIDPIHQVVELQRKFARQGLYFPVHVDAAWGGYLASLIRTESGDTLPYEELRKNFRYFPSSDVYQSLCALEKVDSVTVDPHKLGYLPFGVGGVVYRNHLISKIQAEKADYVFRSESDDGFANLGQFILEGSKPGAAAAAVWVNQKVMPLHAGGMGQLIARSIRHAEYFFDRVQWLRERLDGVAAVSIPVEPDSNLVTLAINPIGNRSVAVANAFLEQLVSLLSFDGHKPLQTIEFIATSTRLYRENLSSSEARRLCLELGLGDENFCEDADPAQGQANTLLIMRHTLMCPWLIENDSDFNYLDAYFACLEAKVLELAPHFVGASGRRTA